MPADNKKFFVGIRSYQFDYEVKALHRAIGLNLIVYFRCNHSQATRFSSLNPYSTYSLNEKLIEHYPTYVQQDNVTSSKLIEGLITCHTLYREIERDKGCVK